MSTKDEQALIGRAMMEPAFRQRLLSDPEGTIREEGLTVSDALLQQFKGMDAGIADEVGRVIGAIFGQSDTGELGDDDMEAVAGGTLPAGYVARIALPEVGLTPQGLGTPFIDPRMRAPTTW